MEELEESLDELFEDELDPEDELLEPDDELESDDELDSDEDELELLDELLDDELELLDDELELELELLDEHCGHSGQSTIGPPPCFAAMPPFLHHSFGIRQSGHHCRLTTMRTHQRQTKSSRRFLGRVPALVSLRRSSPECRGCSFR